MLANFAQTVTYYTDYTDTTTSSSSLFTPAFAPIWIMILILLVVWVVSLWRIFTKLGRPGWAAIVPVYSSWVLFEIVGYPGWWALLSVLPIVWIFPGIMIYVALFKLGKLFGKSDTFSIMLALFSVILLPSLAFGKAGVGASVNASGPMPANGPAMPMPPSMPQQPMPSAPMPTVAPVAPTAPVVSSDNQQQPPQAPPAGPAAS